MKSHLKLRLVKFTPKLAKQYLSNSRWSADSASQNRNLSRSVIVKYLRTMKRGSWNSYPPLHVDSNGKTVDGHHRLHAVIAFGGEVYMHVMENLTEPEVESLDTGRKRSLAERQGMFTELTYRSERNSWLALQAELLVGRRISLFDFSDYDEWYGIFNKGIDFGVENLAMDHFVKAAAVSGAISFAFPTNPEAVADFAMKLRDGNDLKTGDPVLVLRNHMQRNHKSARSGGLRILTARRVLNAIRSRIEGEKISKLFDTDTGLRFFSKHYTSNRRTKSVVKDWADMLKAVKVEKLEKRPQLQVA